MNNEKINYKPDIELIECEFNHLKMPFIKSIHNYDKGLEIEITFDNGKVYLISFDNVTGFRALEEDNLNEFFEPMKEIQGWLWEVKDGGWFSLEKTRKAFLTGYEDFYLDEKEYLIMSMTYCVNILSRFTPKITFIKK